MHLAVSQEVGFPRSLSAREGRHRAPAGLPLARRGPRRRAAAPGHQAHNLFLCRLGLDFDVVKVLDFGLFKSLRGEDANLTADGALTGTKRCCQRACC